MASGGKREGSGRPSLGAKRKLSLTIRLSPEMVRRVKVEAASQNLSISVLIQDVLERAIK